MMNYNPMLLTDFYKIGHYHQYPQGTEVVFSTWTPRMSRIKGVDKVVFFGLQYFIKAFLIDYFNTNFFNRPKEDVVAEYTRVIKFTLGVDNPYTGHIERLHDLGHLPITIRAVKEGTLVPLRVPMLAIYNTRPDEVDTFWVTNFLETLMSSELWQPMTNATVAYEYRKILDRYALETVGNTEFVGFQGHDFSLRGMAGVEAGAKSGAGHLLSFVGTDTIPSILFHEKYYGANIEKELVGTSVNATEHSVMCANSDSETRDEFESFRRLIEDVYPSGIVSIVSDTYDFWKVVGEILPSLKDKIMARDGKVVIRPDSGDPVDILCGKHIPDLSEIWKGYNVEPEDARDYFADELHDMDLCGDGYCGDSYYTFKFKLKDKYYTIKLEVEYNRHDKRYYYIESIRTVKVEEYTPKLSDLGLIEALWNIFGGTITPKGYKLLDSHIGAIYGDSITLERAEEIGKRLKEKGFASINVVLGIGSFTYQYNTRDTFGFAMKATYSVVNGEERLLFKDPKTDDGVKRSQRGLVAVFPNPSNSSDGSLVFMDGLTKEEYEKSYAFLDHLEPVFTDGKLVREQTLLEIRGILGII